MRTILFLIYFFVISIAFSQNKCNSSEKKLRKVEKHVLNGDTEKAINLLTRIETICEDPFFVSSVADIYFNLKDINRAYYFYFKSYILNGLNDIQNYSVFNFLNAAYNTGNYHVFHEVINNDYFINRIHTDSFIVDLIKKNNFAFNKKKDSVSFNPVCLDINSSKDEYFPSMPIDSEIMIYTCRDNVLNFKDEDFFISRKINGNWSQPIQLGDNINSEYREGSLSVSLDGRDIFFASCHRPDSYGGCDLYYSFLINDTLWSKSYNLGSVINTKYWESQPSISADGNLLFFSSNREGGYGGSDIWMSRRINKHWLEPVNLGPLINTSLDESTPFLHYDNKTFYFSSKGHAGFGGFDLYVANIDSLGVIANVSNLGYPINTHFDESGLIVSRDGEKAYYNSNLENNLNIYSFDLPSKFQSKPVAFINGIVIDSISRRPINSDIIINELNHMIEYNLSSDQDGNFACSTPLKSHFSITVMAEGYDFFSSNYYLEEDEYSKSIEIVLNRLNIGNKINLDNIYYEFDDYSLKEESLIEIEKFANYLLANNKLKVEVEGHTDNVGSESYNTKLSKQRAKSVYDALITFGVSFKQLSYRGYGYSMPLIDEDSDDARDKNRRTEIKVIGNYE